MLLLVVLGMLTLFLMIGTAFVISSNQYRRANKSYSKFSEQENLRIAQEEFLGEVINQLIRDTTNQNSALRFHSLLRDLYGTEGFRGEVLVPSQGVASPSDPTFVQLAPKYAGAPGGTTDVVVFGPTIKQFIEFAVYDSLNANDTERPKDMFGNNFQLNTMPDYYAGQVLTWSSGPLSGKSTRIVKSRYDAALEYSILTVVASPQTNDALLLPFRGTVNSSRTPELTQLANIEEGNNFGAEFIINGRPFNGTGVGYNAIATPGMAKLDANEPVPGVPNTMVLPISLMPNGMYFDSTTAVVSAKDPTNGTPLTIPPPQSYFGPNYFSLTPQQQNALQIIAGLDGLGGSDESYDAPDFQNMFLAWTGPNIVDTIFTSLDSTPDPDSTPTNPLPPFTRAAPPSRIGSIVLPSFHRPDLINYWANQFLPSGATSVWESTLADSGGVGLLRKIMLRPNWHDHPDFDGSNPEYAATASSAEPRRDKLLRMIYGPWDVDNDNDGVRDSVWIDFGAPVMIGANGRLVKPLAAVMVLDMDGRLNVNAHATRELAGLGAGLEQSPASNPAGLPDWDDVPEGQGFGPAEISLRPILNNGFGGVHHRFDEVLNGDTIFGTFYPGRYGSGNDNEPGARNRYDLAAQLKMQGFPSHYNNTLILSRSNFATLPDLRARYKTALGDFGQFVTTWTPQDSVAHALDEDNPYELDLSSTGPRGKGTGVDNPFSLAELERLVRMFDIDAGSLSPRLYEILRGGRPQSLNPSDANYAQQLAQYSQDLKNYRTLLTTDSFDLPEPGFQMPAWVRTGVPGVANSDYFTVMGRPPINGTYADLIEYRFRVSQEPIWYVADDNLPANTGRLPALRIQLQRVIAPEMLAGLKLDLNRPFGNGRDDGNGIDDNGNSQIDEMAEYGIDPVMNGVVDEPGEREFAIDNDNDGLVEEADGDKPSLWSIDYNRAGQNRTLASSGFELSSYLDDHDRNGDGTVDRWERGDFLPDNNSNNIVDAADGDSVLSDVELVVLHNYRRQLQARYLYVLAMALVDPLPEFDTGGAPLTPAQIRERKLILTDRARRLAQWAINVVDYRDPDNIMTAFEYDALPFNGWQVDEDIRTTYDLPNWSDNIDAATGVGIDDNGNGLINRADVTELSHRNGIDDDGDTKIDDDDPDEIAERQVVWGLERPEILMTETLAWHDRATEDLNTEDEVTDDNSDLVVDNDDRGEVGTADIKGTDVDFDQRVKPQGATFIEFYNPYPRSPVASADTHIVQGINGVNFSGVDPGTDLGVDLSAVDRVSRTSPVWRLDVRKPVEFKGINPTQQLYVGGPDHDPDDPDPRTQPQIPDRTVYFTNFDPQVANANWDTFDGAPYYCSRALPNDPTTHAIVRPGGYLVAGSGVPVNTQGIPVNDPINAPAEIDRYEAWIGELNPKPYTWTVPNQPRRAIVLDTKANAPAPVMLRDNMPGNLLPAAAAVQDQANFRVFAEPSMTSVAIIDRGPRGYHRFSVSEPAYGYPDKTFTSSFQKAKYYSDPRGEYDDPLDIPLDNQRWDKSSFGAGSVVDGQKVLNAFASPRWYRSSKNPPYPPSPTSLAEMRKDNDLRLTLPELEENSVRTIPGFSWIYLQRLANPLLPWNPAPGHQKHRPDDVVNPYLTVDSMGVNVTVFNGQEKQELRRGGSGIMDYGNDAPFQTFSSLQRGRANEVDVEKNEGLLRFVGRLRYFQGGAPEPSNTNGQLQPVQSTGFRNAKIGPGYKGGTVFDYPGSLQDPDTPSVQISMIRDPHQPGHSQTNVNLWAEEQVGHSDGVTAPRKMLGMWLNRGGPNGNGNYNLGVGGNHFFNSIPDTTLGFLNEPFRSRTAVNEFERKYLPAQPFSSLAWNNRPYANSGELLQVPAFRSSQLLKIFGVLKGPFKQTDNKGEFTEQYKKYTRGGIYPPVLMDQTNTNWWDSQVNFPEFVADGPFGHLPNFFRMETVTTTTPAATLKFRDITGLHRVLHCVSVPSPYVGSDTWLSPVPFGKTSAPIPGPVKSSSDPRYGFQPPFNKVASRREPGKVNINTIVSGSVWHGIFHGSAKRNGVEEGHPVMDDDGFASVRRGYGQLGQDPTLLNAASPTLFANPFRPANTGDLVPLAALLRTDTESTLMRSTGEPQLDPGNPTTGIPVLLGTTPIPQTQPAGVPLFTADTIDDPATPVNPADPPIIENKHRDSNRNPYYRYSPISRLTGMTTTRSNVFAVWVTIGFFEVEEINDTDHGGPNGILSRYGGTLAAARNDPLFHLVYPDGFTFGKEAGLDTGQNIRYREFAIIDRTIPVAFEPGANHNVGEAIRLRRKIE